VLSDINATMLAVGRDRLLDDGISNVSLCQADAQALPFGNASFDCLTIGFGLRNVTDKERALREMWRVLRPGGVLLILEFSHIENPLLRTAYQGFQALWPSAGRLLVGDADAYTYLVESIRVHPKQRALKLMISDAGFTKVEYHNLAGGAAAIHRAEVPQDNG
jgi:demethylmenaquinone methyltransferase/2-methoxy-6-polyprenyl-1,4-benzoquinol methylase